MSQNEEKKESEVAMKIEDQSMIEPLKKDENAEKNVSSDKN